MSGGLATNSSGSSDGSTAAPRRHSKLRRTRQHVNTLARISHEAYRGLQLKRGPGPPLLHNLHRILFAVELRLSLEMLEAAGLSSSLSGLRAARGLPEYAS